MAMKTVLVIKGTDRLPKETVEKLLEHVMEEMQKAMPILLLPDGVTIEMANVETRC